MKKHNFQSIMAGLAFAGLLLIAGSAGAQKFLENYKKPMPEMDLIPQATFEAETEIQKDTPFSDQALAYEVRVPKGWEKHRDVGSSDAAVGTKILGELVRFYGPPKMGFRSYLTIKALKLDYQLTAEQWFIQYLLSNSYTLQGIRTIDDQRVEALYVYVEKDVTYAVRTFAQINGARVVMAQYYLPVDSWEAEKQMQAQTINSFKLTNKVKEDVEPMQPYYFLDIAKLRYPESWDLLSEPLKSIDRLRVRLLSVASEEKSNFKNYKLLNGRMEILLASHFAVSGIDEELKRFKEDLTKSGLIIESFIEYKKDFTAGLHKSFEARPVEVYVAEDTKNKLIDYELWLLVMESGDYYYIVTLLTPSRDEDYYMWSRNTQTFRVIAETITPNEGTLVGN